MHGPGAKSGLLWAFNRTHAHPTLHIHNAGPGMCPERSFAGNSLVAFNIRPASAERNPTHMGSCEEYYEAAGVLCDIPRVLVLVYALLLPYWSATSVIIRIGPDAELALLEDLKMDNTLDGACAREGRLDYLPSIAYCAVLS